MLQSWLGRMVMEARPIFGRYEKQKDLKNMIPRQQMTGIRQLS